LRYSARSLFALAAASSCVALSGATIAAASTVQANKVAVTPPADCANVSAAAVSGIVGYKVPAPTSDTGSYPVDPALKISATATDCSYETMPTAADPSGAKVVSLSYEVFNKKVTEKILKEAEAAEQAKESKEEKAINFKAKYSSYSGLGVTAIYFTITSQLNLGLPKGVPVPKGMNTSFDLEGIATLNGENSFGAAVNNLTLPKSELADLVRLAMKIPS
jgi:flagellar capping protein FliD